MFCIQIFRTNVASAAFSSCMYVVKAAETTFVWKILTYKCWWNLHKEADTIFSFSINTKSERYCNVLINLKYGTAANRKINFFIKKLSNKRKLFMSGVNFEGCIRDPWLYELDKNQRSKVKLSDGKSWWCIFLQHRKTEQSER